MHVVFDFFAEAAVSFGPSSTVYYCCNCGNGLQTVEMNPYCGNYGVRFCGRFTVSRIRWITTFMVLPPSDRFIWSPRKQHVLFVILSYHHFTYSTSDCCPLLYGSLYSASWFLRSYIVSMNPQRRLGPASWLGSFEDKSLSNDDFVSDHYWHSQWGIAAWHVCGCLA